MKNLIFLVSLFLNVAILGCEKKAETPAAKGEAKPVAPNASATAKTTAATKKDEHGHEGHDRAADEIPAAAGGKSGHSGEVIELGTVELEDQSVRASRDKGTIAPGGDAPVDVWIDGGLGKDVGAVRFWIGAADAKGSLKAKADVEDGKWHTHVEVPDPMPAESKLWVEIEMTGGKKMLATFDLQN